MESYLYDVEKQLRAVTEQYHRIIISKIFDYSNWKEKVELLFSIVDKLLIYAKERIDICQKRTAELEKRQKEQISIRVQLYERLSEKKGQVSSLDIERVKIRKEINVLSQEMEAIQKEMVNLQREVAEAGKEKEYWDTVYWATCWIPFVNIGTGVKKGKEEGNYRARVKICEEDYQRKRYRTAELTNQSHKIEARQRKNGESSSQMANQVTAIEGQISEVTNTLNVLRQEIALWHNILTACQKIEVQLRYTNGKIERVMKCFYQLTEVGELLDAPSTDRFIKGCIWKGDMLAAGEKLKQNEYLLSKNRRFVLVMQTDNNLVIYHSEKAIWNTQTCGAEGEGYVELDADGLVSLKGTNKNWDTRRAGALVLIMQDDGNLVTYDKEGKAIWASDTYIYANASGIYFQKNYFKEYDLSES